MRSAPASGAIVRKRLERDIDYRLLEGVRGAGIGPLKQPVCLAATPYSTVTCLKRAGRLINNGVTFCYTRIILLTGSPLGWRTTPHISGNGPEAATPRMRDGEPFWVEARPSRKAADRNERPNNFGWFDGARWQVQTYNKVLQLSAFLTPVYSPFRAGVKPEATASCLISYT